MVSEKETLDFLNYRFSVPELLCIGKERRRLGPPNTWGERQRRQRDREIERERERGNKRETGRKQDRETQRGRGK